MLYLWVWYVNKFKKVKKLKFRNEVNVIENFVIVNVGWNELFVMIMFNVVIDNGKILMYNMNKCLD